MNDFQVANLQKFTFETLDELGLAFTEGNLKSNAPLPYRFSATGIGPLIEFAQLASSNVMPESIASAIEHHTFREFYCNLRNRRSYWTCEKSGRLGVMRLGNNYGDKEETLWTTFSIRAKKAAEKLFPSALAGQLVGAVKEMHSNVYEHSGRSNSGIVAFAALNGAYEMIIADQGMGVLESLRSNPHYAHLKSDAEALRLAIQPGVSRHAEHSLRGYGFKNMFTGLLNLNSRLRFRSGTGAVSIDGFSDGDPVPIVHERAPIPGFLVSVACNVI